MSKPKIISKRQGLVIGECSNCGKSVVSTYTVRDNYCSNCGEKQDWSD